MGTGSTNAAIKMEREVGNRDIEHSAATNDGGFIVEEGKAPVNGNETRSNEKSEIAQQVEQQVEGADKGTLAGWVPWRRDGWKIKRMNAFPEGEALENVGSNEELLPDGEEGGDGAAGEVVWKVYKRRWFGLGQLVLLNVVVSWDWLSFAPVSTTTSQYFDTSMAAINWLSTTFLFAFVIATPFTIYVLHRGGPKQAIIVASILLLLGNWIRYGGTKGRNLGAVMFGQILTGFAQPFVLSAPTRYSDLWFTNNGRVAATAVMSLANPFGGALGQLIDPFWAENPEDIPNMVLYISIIATVAAIPSFFVPAAPPTPCSPSSTTHKMDILPSLRLLFTSPEFYMILIPFHVYVGLFNSLSSLLNQILYPYTFTEEEAGIAGAILIVVGLVTSAITSPLIDRSKKFLLAIKLQVPLVAICYLAFIWAPPTRTIAAVYIILALLGAASFSLVPVALEYVTEITHPVSPEVTSAICWSGGQLLGGIFIVVSDKLQDGESGGEGGSVPWNMQRALWFHAAIALAVVAPPMASGMFGRGDKVRLRRVEADKAYNRGERASVEVEV